jgi:transcription-repair coupling factor (superfamily II helicase)
VSGSSQAHPKLDRLGSLSFSKRKSRAKKDIYQIAHDLMQIAAERKLKVVDRKLIDEGVFQDFCDHFGFDLTPDQDSAIRDCLDDLQKPFPMDRLICGDVGFGKTEVALRAAMFRLLQGTQVAVLAPTTLLAEQHFRNFKKRFEVGGFRVERVSRFISAAEQKKILEDLAAGRVDLIIGTHRLLQKDVCFKNLGMLIIDEEQRFGVKHKERIKKIRSELDVLALSATPIPRTLQMSIVGIRELSLIVSPPEIREAVDTYVGGFDKKLIREKVMREIDRGGQVFFVHNRVKSLPPLKEELEEILPQIKIVVAHGQMHEDELEDTMLTFIEKKADLLLATSIIENGIDIPNANTLIVDRADLFGLSDLYQLRGRVGRGSRKAFSFFLIREETPITTEASKRLQVLQSCTELGSGFKVASHDLEIRGAGNLLGEAQSGVISEIGLELYNQLLQETLDEIKGGKLLRLDLPEVKAAFAAFIPEDYIPDASLRISTYRRLNQIQNLQELFAFEEELLDRFGLFSHEVETLLAVTRLRLRASGLHAAEVDCSPGRLQLELKASTPLDPIQLSQQAIGGLHFDSKGRLVYQYPSAFQNPQLLESSKFDRAELYDLHESLHFVERILPSPDKPHSQL